MPTASVSNSFFDIQIRFRTSERLSVLQVALALIEAMPRLLKKAMKTLQSHWLEDDLGPPGAVGNLFDEHGFCCPECGKPGANRKDWKDRHPILPVMGEVAIPQRRVECRACESVYRPYEDELGLPENKQYTTEALLEGIRNTLVTSYKRAATLMRADVSPRTLHRAVQETKPQADQQKAEYALVVVDATDVPKWKESGQITLTLAHEVSQGPTVYERSTLNRKVVALAAGAEEDIKALLEAPSIKGLMHDGKLRVEGLSEVEGRCLWHVPYTTRHLLYQDGISGEKNKRLVRELSGIMFDEETSAEKRERELRQWVEDHQEEAPRATGHVQKALDGVRNVEKHSSLFEVVTTSPMERAMVELNKRFENGGGWTPEGAEALLWHLQLWLIDPENWLNQVLNDDGSVMSDFLQNSLI